MKERPILFSAPMVRAILAGTKTQTRRVVTLDDPRGRWNAEGYCYGADDGIKRQSWAGDTIARLLRCPYGQPGDRLWVREAWRIGAWRADDGTFAIDYRASPELCRTPWVTIPDDDFGDRFNEHWSGVCDELRIKGVEPDADGHYRWEPGNAPLRWRPSIHMPRWASRITLEVIAVRVERLQQIDEADARAEGISRTECPDWHATTDYRALWESINGPGSWDANPWVWVIEFKRVAAMADPVEGLDALERQLRYLREEHFRAALAEPVQKGGSNG